MESLRARQALAARTQADLATLSADLPAGLITDPPRRQLARVRPRPPVSRVAAGAGLTIPPAALLAVAFLTSNEQTSELCFLVISWFLIAWVLAGTQVLAKWYDKRSGGPLPPRPAQHGLTGETGWHAARQRGTRKTIAGRLAQKYRRPPTAISAPL